MKKLFLSLFTTFIAFNASSNECGVTINLPKNATYEWTGDCVDGLVSGTGALKLINENGYVILEGDFKNGTIKGPGKSTNSGNDVYVGELNGLLKEGQGVLTNEKEKYKLSGNFSNGKLNGIGEREENYYTYKGNFKNSLFNGKGTMTFKNGNIVESIYLNGHAHGNVKVTYPNGEILYYKAVNGKPVGEGFIVNGDNQKVVEYIDGKWTQKRKFNSKDETELNKLQFNVDDEFDKVCTIRRTGGFFVAVNTTYIWNHLDLQDDNNKNGLARIPFLNSNKKRAGFCNAKLPLEPLFSGKISVDTSKNVKDSKYAIDSRWTGQCIDGKISGAGQLVVSVGQECDPTVWLIYDGFANSGVLSGKSSLIHQVDGSDIRNKLDIFFLDGISFTSQRDYEETINPKLKDTRLAREEKERRDHEAQIQADISKYEKLKNKGSAREMYLAANNYEESDKNRSIELYKAITSRHPSSQEALLASGRLNKLRDNDRSNENVRNLRNDLYQSQLNSYEQCKKKFNSCKYSCGELRTTDARMSCYSSCVECVSP